MSCPFPGPRSTLSSSCSSHCSPQDKKQYEKQATRHRIGNAFRNSWGRKDTEYKNNKKSNSLVMNSNFINVFILCWGLWAHLFFLKQTRMRSVTNILVWNNLITSHHYAWFAVDGKMWCILSWNFSETCWFYCWNVMFIGSYGWICWINQG